MTNEDADRERREKRKTFLKVWGQIAVLLGVATEGGLALWKAHQGADATVVKEAVQTNFDHAEAAYARAIADERDLQLLRADLGTLRQEVNEARARFMEILLQLARDQPQYRQVSLPPENLGTISPGSLGGSGYGTGGGRVGGASRPNLNPAAVLLQDRLAKLAKPEPKPKGRTPLPPRIESSAPAPAPMPAPASKGMAPTAKQKIENLLEKL